MLDSASLPAGTASFSAGEPAYLIGISAPTATAVSPAPGTVSPATPVGISTVTSVSLAPNTVSGVIAAETPTPGASAPTATEASLVASTNKTCVIVIASSPRKRVKYTLVELAQISLSLNARLKGISERRAKKPRRSR